MIENQLNGGEAPEGFALPKAAVELINVAALSQWSVGWTWDKDSGAAPFVTVHVGDVDSGEYFKFTWHSRDTGTLRLFSKLHRKASGCLWADGPSVKAAIFRTREVAHQRS